MDSRVTIDLFGVVCLLSMSAWFYLLRRPAWFSAASAVTVLVCLVAGEWWRGDATAIVMGVIAYWLGLLFVRAMLARSVSLAILASVVRAERADVNALIASRLDDAAKHRLAACESGRYALTPLGRLVARAMGPSA